MKTLTIHCNGQINPDVVVKFKKVFLDALALQSPPDEIVIMLSSIGGSTWPVIELYWFFRTVPIPITICNAGVIESNANTVFLSADKRVALPVSRFLLHGFETVFAQTTVPYNGVVEAFYSLNNDIERIANIYEERTQGAKVAIDIRQHLKGTPLILGPKEALAAGITTDDIGDIGFDFGIDHIYL